MAPSAPGPQQPGPLDPSVCPTCGDNLMARKERVVPAIESAPEYGCTRCQRTWRIADREDE